MTATNILLKEIYTRTKYLSSLILKKNLWLLPNKAKIDSKSWEKLDTKKTHIFQYYRIYNRILPRTYFIVNIYSLENLWRWAGFWIILINK